jgi:hypothetical protein
VKGDNVSMWQIAETELGDQKRWQEIARLNPSFRSDSPLPSNATIYLPSR